MLFKADETSLFMEFVVLSPSMYLVQYDRKHTSGSLVT